MEAIQSGVHSVDYSRCVFEYRSARENQDGSSWNIHNRNGDLFNRSALRLGAKNKLFVSLTILVDSDEIRLN